MKGYIKMVSMVTGGGRRRRQQGYRRFYRSGAREKGKLLLGKKTKKPKGKKLKKGYEGVIQGLFRAIQGYSGAS